MYGIKFIKFQPNMYVLKYKHGKIVEEGYGLSFFYYAPTTSLVAIPISSIEAPFIFEESTQDFQTITIQGQVTFRIQDVKKLLTEGLLGHCLAHDHSFSALRESIAGLYEFDASAERIQCLEPMDVAQCAISHDLDCSIFQCYPQSH